MLLISIAFISGLGCAGACSCRLCRGAPAGMAGGSTKTVGIGGALLLDSASKYPWYIVCRRLCSAAHFSPLAPLASLSSVPESPLMFAVASYEHSDASECWAAVAARVRGMRLFRLQLTLSGRTLHSSRLGRVEAPDSWVKDVTMAASSGTHPRQGVHASAALVARVVHLRHHARQNNDCVAQVCRQQRSMIPGVRR